MSSLVDRVEALENDFWKVARELAQIKTNLQTQDVALDTLLEESKERKAMAKTLLFIGKLLPFMLAFCVALLGGLMWLIQHTGKT